MVLPTARTARLAFLQSPRCDETSKDISNGTSRGNGNLRAPGSSRTLSPLMLARAWRRCAAFLATILLGGTKRENEDVSFEIHVGDYSS